MTDRRLSICYAAPGLNLLPSAGPTRNVLSVAEALTQWADVTVAFRRILEPIGAPAKYNVIAIEPRASIPTNPRDDNATRGLNPIPHALGLRCLWSFSRRLANSYDLVLEKGWRLSGLLLAACARQGLPGALVENDTRCWSGAFRSFRTIGQYTLHRTAESLASFYSRRAPLVIAETEELKAMLVTHRGISPDRIEVVGLGVDHALFRPLEQESARKSLGLSPAATLLLYVGGMDEYHDLGPLIEAFTHIRRRSVELHLVGDGEYRMRYEEKAKAAHTPVRFHGQVPHSTVPQYIAAADVCLAPYRTRAFPHGRVFFSTLKIPEYMACARPVVSVPGGHIQRLIEDRVSGFLFPNEVSCWEHFLNVLPSRLRLAEMGQAAARTVEGVTWEATAARYLVLGQKLTAHRDLLGP